MLLLNYKTHSVGKVFFAYLQKPLLNQNQCSNQAGYFLFDDRKIGWI